MNLEKPRVIADSTAAGADERGQKENRLVVALAMEQVQANGDQAAP